MTAAPRWEPVPLPDASSVAALVRELRIPPALGALLVQRGYVTADAAKRFLRPRLRTLSDPYSLRDMDRAVGLVRDAVGAGRAILVHGDYDVDGQCATALLTRFLREAGATVVPFVPHRIRDGYDFGPAGVERATTDRVGLVVTADCGTTAVEAVRAVQGAGIPVVVTDHHLPGETAPADAMVNPQHPDCTSGLGQLSGTGVAFKLAQALAPELGLSDRVPLAYLDLVALATVADVVPLAGENRTLVRYGLKALETSRWPGLRALVEVAGLARRPLRAGHIGYILAPRLNAAGRIGDAADGVRLLLTDDPVEAETLARNLDAINVRRQALDEEVLAQASEEIELDVDLDRTYGLVLARDGWHPGVIGLVASRVVERVHRPTILIALDDTEGRGSGRSIPGFDLHAALTECATHLLRYGGHRMAAGLTLAREDLDAFRAAFNDAARSRLEADDLVPRQRIDVLVPLGDLTDELERLLRHLEPCGPSNPAPVFGVRGTSARGTTTLRGGHVRFSLDDGACTLAAIAFGFADRVPQEWWRRPLDVALRLERNEWRGQSTLQARVVAVRSTDDVEA